MKKTFIAAFVIILAGCDSTTFHPRVEAAGDSGAMVIGARDITDGDVALGEAAIAPSGGRLGALPSPPGPHIAQLQALGAEEWINLGSPKADPEWGKARGRTWTANMALVSDRRGAFLFGEGIHGWFNKTNGRYMDDLWLYDIMAHAWVNLYPGADTNNEPELIVNNDGFIALTDGTPLQIASMVHGYQMTTWDPATQRFLSMPSRGSGYWSTGLPSFAAFLTAHKDTLNTTHASPWFFDTTSDTFDRRRTESRSPPINHGATLKYIPSESKTFYRNNTGQVWFYDSADNTWTAMDPAGPPPPFGIDPTSSHDTRRNRIYMGGGLFPIVEAPNNALWIYDIASNTWIDPSPAGQPEGGNKYNTNLAMMHYDETNDVVLLFRYGPTRAINVYWPKENRWETLSTKLPDEWIDHWTKAGSSGFYDPVLNVHFFHMAGDSMDNGEILAFRFRP